MRIKVFADGADPSQMATLESKVDGFTTNPSLMKSAGINDYRAFAKEVLAITQKPVSFEVLSDDWREMEAQAREIAAWGRNVYVKIPVTNCAGESSAPLIDKLAQDGIRLNVTAVMTQRQINNVQIALNGKPSIVSVFAGRIADTGVDPCYTMKRARFAIGSPVLLLWASAREVYNVYQADQLGCDIITLAPDLIKKLSLRGKGLTEYSRETVQQFHRDAEGLTI